MSDHCLRACRAPVRWIVHGVFRLELERQLWMGRRQTRQLIHWALKWPNDHNLETLILQRHRLRQARLTWEQDAELLQPATRDSWEARRMRKALNQSIEALEEAISHTETVLG